MNPVMRTLQTIAAIQSETREPIHVEAASKCPASKCPTEPLRPQKVRASSIASSKGHDRPTAPSAQSKATTDLNRGSGAPPIRELETTTPEAAFACGREIRIDKRDRVVAAPARDVTRHTITIISGALLLALVLCLGWIEALNSGFFTVKPASLPIEQGSADPSDAAKSDRLAVQGSSANPVATASSSTHEIAKRGAQTTDSLTKQAIRAPQAPAVERTKVSAKPAPVPETRPTTIEGWTIREVNGGTAVLEGPNGVWKAMRGDTVPGVGKIDSIVRWGNRWIVATSKGLISTR
jgi:hypothetical protein